MRRLVCRSVLFLSVLLALATSAAAQGRGEKLGPDGEPVPLTEQELRRARGFNLFGAADYAESSIRTPSLYIMTLANAGVIDNFRRLMHNFTDPALRPFNTSFGNARVSGFSLTWGTPPSERAKIIALAGAAGAGLALANGRGFNWISAREVATQGDNLQPSDNQLGPLFKGLQSTSDRSCLDHRGNAFPISGSFFLPAGTPLLAGSDCPQTWGTRGWQGTRPVEQRVFLNAAQANPSNFRFDSWKFPEFAPTGTLERQYGNFQTYGSFSDYNKDDLCGAGSQRTFGRVVRKTLRGSHCADVPPNKEGYPLGLEARVDAFNYGLPSLQDVAWYEILITNNSADLYGVGIDYDSLYIAFSSGLQATSQQTPVYYRPEDGGTYWTGTCSQQPGPKGKCNGAASATDITVVRATPPSSGSAWQLGSAVILILKSPIGDLRNKLFSRPSSPFSQIAVPASLKDDTITFNHGHHCGFRACAARQVRDVIGSSQDFPQRAFGMVSSIEKHVIGDNASLTDLAFQVGATNLWHLFRSADFPSNGGSVGPLPTQFPQRGGFNRWVPGATGTVGQWDYNNDGVSDTLYYDTCTSKSGGTDVRTSCSGLWSDTMPHSPGLPALLNGYANSMQISGVGPIKLRSRDTVSFVVAVTAGCCGPAKSDSIRLAAKVSAAINHYLNFYLAPDVLPRDTIAAVDVVGGNFGTARVTLTFTETAERSTDPFLLSKAEALNAAAVGSDDERLLKLNPFLADSLRLFALPFGTPTRRFRDATTDIAVGNFEALFIFKSCDNGATYTTSADCEPARSVSGPFAQLGFLPYATLTRDANGDFPNTFTDVNVNGGTTYTYVLVGKSRGPTLNLLTGDAIDSVPKTGGGFTYFCKLNCLNQAINFSPSLFNPIASSGPNVATVYVPTSTQAGGTRPLIVVSTTAGPVPKERVLITNQSQQPRAGTYTIQFFDSVNVTVVDSLDKNQRARLKTSSTVVGFKGTAATTFTTTALGGPGLNGATVRTTTITPVTGGAIRTVTSTLGPATAGVKAVVSLGDEAILVTNQLTPSATPETFFSSGAFPGFTVGFAAADPLVFNVTAGEQFVDALGRPIGPLVAPFVRINTTTLVVPATGQGGKYTFTYLDTPFGPGEPFRLDFANPAATQAAFTSSLEQRAVAQTTVVSDSAAIAAFGTGFTADSLVAARLPFSIVNESFNRPVLAVMRKRPASTRIRLLGEGRDTLTVTVPLDVWLPGDELVFLERLTDTGPLVRTVTRIVLECTNSRAARTTCNPLALLSVGTGGFNGNVFVTTPKGTKQSILINPRITTAQQFSFSVAGTMAGANLTAGCTRASDSGCVQIKRDLRNVRVVPNPYLGFSEYNDPTSTASALFRPLLFSNVPPRGVLRIYTVSGQLVQQIRWVETDLNDTGDLLWNLRTRENTFIAGGMYLAMVTAESGSGASLGSRMIKFVVIR